MKIFLNGKMGTNKLSMPFLALSEMNSLMYTVNINYQKIFEMQ